MENKKRSVSKKIRFEVFKRDSFTCQYCGKKAPDIILHIDHLKPVSKGGKNNILNLVTSCVDCNLGKGATELSDNTVIEKARKQSEFLQQRIEQIEMMRDWQLSLIDEERMQVDAVNDLFEKLTGGELTITESYKTSKILPLVKKYGVVEVMEALRSGTSGYGDPERALDKIGGICYCRNNKEASDRSIILNLMNRKFYNFKRWEASEIIKQGYIAGGENFYDKAKELINSVSGTWHQVKDSFYSLVDTFTE